MCSLSIRKKQRFISQRLLTRRRLLAMKQLRKKIWKKVKASLTQGNLAELARATHELKFKQETPDPLEALKCVPSVSLKDIPKKPIHIPTEVITITEVGIGQIQIIQAREKDF